MLVLRQVGSARVSHPSLISVRTTRWQQTPQSVVHARGNGTVFPAHRGGRHRMKAQWSPCTGIPVPLWECAPRWGHNGVWTALRCLLLAAASSRSAAHAAKQQAGAISTRHDNGGATRLRVRPTLWSDVRLSDVNDRAESPSRMYAPGTPNGKLKLVRTPDVKQEQAKDGTQVEPEGLRSLHDRS
jgi:hypothetical protein